MEDILGFYSALSPIFDEEPEERGSGWWVCVV
jgi:hypothetical protein